MYFCQTFVYFKRFWKWAMRSAKNHTHICYWSVDLDMFKAKNKRNKRQNSDIRKLIAVLGSQNINLLLITFRYKQYIMENVKSSWLNNLCICKRMKSSLTNRKMTFWWLNTIIFCIASFIFTMSIKLIRNIFSMWVI